MADSDDYDIEDDISSYSSAIYNTPSSLSHTKRHVKHRCRRSKREERKKRFDDVNSLLQSNLNMCKSNSSALVLKSSFHLCLMFYSFFCVWNQNQVLVV